MGSTQLIANDDPTMTVSPIHTSAQLYGELWVSLASLLRSYTAIHGLNGKRQATVELGEETILVRHAESWLEFTRAGARLNWKSDDHHQGQLEFTDHGRLRAVGSETTEEEMDMAAERWARELMMRPDWKAREGQQ